MKNLILISLFINVHADCNFGSNSELQNKVDQWSSGQLGQNDACYDIENWNVRLERSIKSQTFELKPFQNHRSNK